MDVTHIIQSIGYIGIFLIVFAESGLLFGFFLPGDSLLFTAGFLASQNIFNIWILLPLCFLAAVSGDSVGYWFGNKVGRKLFHKEDSLFFHRENLEKANAFYKRHGRKTIIIARFLPFIRTFAPIVAGIGDMEYKTFLTFNLIGGFFWSIGVTIAGYYLGRIIPDVDKYLLPAIAIIILLTSAPSIYHVLKDERTRNGLIKELKGIIHSKKRK